MIIRTYTYVCNAQSYCYRVSVREFAEIIRNIFLGLIAIYSHPSNRMETASDDWMNNTCKQVLPVPYSIGSINHVL